MLDFTPELPCEDCNNPATHRLIRSCGCAVCLICRQHAEGASALIRRAALNIGTVRCADCKTVIDARIEPLR